MPSRTLRICAHRGCPNLTRDKYCPEHAADAKAAEVMYDRRRGSAQERGYDGRWQKYSKHYLAQPEHQLCRLHLDEGCANIAQCVDHIQPCGPDDPLFWDPTNHQPACIHCNSVKGNKRIEGTYEL